MPTTTVNTKTSSGNSFNELKTKRQIEVDKGNSKPKSFKEIFGDLSKLDFYGDLDLSGLNLSSMEGCFGKISNSGFFP